MPRSSDTVFMAMLRREMAERAQQQQEAGAAAGDVAYRAADQMRSRDALEGGLSERFGRVSPTMPDIKRWDGNTGRAQLGYLEMKQQQAVAAQKAKAEREALEMQLRGKSDVAQTGAEARLGVAETGAGARVEAAKIGAEPKMFGAREAQRHNLVGEEQDYNTELTRQEQIYLALQKYAAWEKAARERGDSKTADLFGQMALNLMSSAGRQSPLLGQPVARKQYGAAVGIVEKIAKARGMDPEALRQAFQELISASEGGGQDPGTDIPDELITGE